MVTDYLAISLEGEVMLQFDLRLPLTDALTDALTVQLTWMTDTPTVQPTRMTEALVFKLNHGV